MKFYAYSHLKLIFHPYNSVTKKLKPEVKRAETDGNLVASLRETECTSNSVTKKLKPEVNGQ